MACRSPTARSRPTCSRPPRAPGRAPELRRAAREGSRPHAHGYHAGMEDRTSQLKNIARRLMREHGLEPDLSTAALEQLRTIGAAPLARGPGIRDLRHLPWCSIDNDDSRDLDQLSVAQPQGGGGVKG